MGLCALFFGVFIVVALLLEPFQRAGLPLDTFSTLLIQQIVAWSVTIWAALRWAGVSFREACPLRPFPVRVVPALLLASFGATILLLEVAGWIPMPKELRDAFAEMSSESTTLTLLLPVVVVAPVAEELFFRGQVLRGYLGRYKTTTAVWASAVLFAMFHLNPWQAIVALPLGAAYAWLTIRTGSLLPGMLSHALVNFSTNFLLVPLAVFLGVDPDKWIETAHLPPAMLLIGGAATAVGGFILWRQLRPRPIAVVPMPLEPEPCGESG
jgi:membrane protease YdiL (CAAX protease family)